MSNKSAYKKRQARSVEVTVDEDKFVLHRPRANATVELRNLMAKMDNTEGQQDPNRMLHVSAKAVGHCMPVSEEWTDEELTDLVVSTGGELGELSVKAMELCGMPMRQAQKAMEREMEDPS